MDDRLPFFGRSEDLARLSDAFGRRRIVQLVGPAGVGKSRLALEYAEGTDEPVLFVELAAAPDAEAVLLEIAIHLGLRLDSAEAAAGVTQVGAALAGRTGLILLDNVEQLAGVIEPMVEAWMRGSSARLMLTSRHPIPLRGAATQAVDPLPPEVAMALLADRRGRSAPDSKVPPASVDTALLDRLDRLPLAIELASRWFAVQTPEEVLARFARDAVDDPLLRRSVRWSWQLLSDPTRAVLSALALLPQGAHAPTISRVAAGTDTPAALRALIDHGLIRRAVDPGALGAARFVVFTTVRAFVLDQLGADRDQLVERFVDDAAAQLSDALDWFACMNVCHGKVCRLDRAALELAWQEVADDDGQATFAVGATLLQSLMLTGPRERALAVAGRVSEVADGLAERRLGAWGRFMRSYARWWWQSPREALTDLAEAGAQAQAAGDARLARTVMRWQLDMESTLGQDVAELMARVAQSPAADAIERAEQAFTLAHVLSRENRPEEAAPLLRTAMAEGKHIGSSAFEAIAAMGLAALVAKAGEFGEARDLRVSALDAARRSGIARHVVAARIGLGIEEIRIGDSSAGRPLLQASQLEAKRSGDTRYQAWTALWLGVADLLDGRDAPALDLIEDAASTFARLGLEWPLSAARGLQALGASLADRAQAREALTRAAATGDHLGLVCAGMLGRSVADVPGWLAWTVTCAQAIAALDTGTDAARAALVDHLRTSDASHYSSRLLRRLAGQEIAAFDAGRPALVVGPSGTWFRDGDGDPVDLARRPKLASMLDALAIHRAARPGVFMSNAELWAFGWPGETAQPESMRKRLQTTVYYLRQSGLGTWIVSDASGYALTLDRPVRRAADAGMIT